MAKKVDKNQAEIVQALRDIGCSVTCTHELGKGFPDIVVGRNEKNYLMEIKSKGGRLNEREERWHDEWRGTADVVYSAEEAIKIVTTPRFRVYVSE